jgi:YbbR domain-containing protein
MAINSSGGRAGDFSKRLFRMIKSDPWRKLFAICCAMLVYYVISNKSINNTRSIDVPVEFVAPQGYVSMMPPDTEVHVTFTGNNSFLNDPVQMSKLRMVMEVPELGAANFREYRVTCSREQLRGLPAFGVQVSEFRPTAIAVKLDKLTNKDVPVIANYNVENELPPEYAVSNVSIIPPKVRISGPASIIRDVKNISTEKIPLTNVTESFEYTTRLRSSEFIQPDRGEVRVKMEISKAYESRVMKSAAVRILKVPGAQDNVKLELMTPHVDVTLRGPRTRLASLKSASIRPYIDISPLNENGVYTVQVYCWQDDNSFSVEKIYPPRIQIKLTRTESN